MVVRGMLPVAVSEGVKVHCPRDGKFSLFNSPYPAHHLGTGIDVYLMGAFGETAPSPVGGEVVEIRRLGCPAGRGFRDSGFDCLTLLRSSENPERLIKILHVDPIVQIGEIVEPGQYIGKLLRSGYFDFWTEPHLHVEVRDPKDPVRARGGFPLHTLLEVGKAEPIEELRGTVEYTKPEYSVITPKGGFRYGIPADVGGETGLLDGGIPHYGWVGAHANGAPSPGGAVRLCGKAIATVRTVRGNTCLAECTGFSLEAKGVGVGLSLYLFPSARPTIKLVPPRLGALKLERSEEISLVYT